MCSMIYRGGGLLPGNYPEGKILSKIPGQNFSVFLRVRTEFFPANLRIVEFYLHKDSNYMQNYFQKFLIYFLYIFLIRAGRDRIFSRTEFSPDRIFPGLNFSLTEFFPDRIFPGQNISLTEFFPDRRTDPPRFVVPNEVCQPTK